MILITVVAVGLLTLSSISLRASSRSSAMAEARANARLAMLHALGELQSAMGPDSRVSAPANIAVAKTGPHSRWTGVYQAWDAASGHFNRPAPVFKRWLVSSANPAGALTEPFASTVSQDEVFVVDQGTLGQPADASAVVKVPFYKIQKTGSSGRGAWWIADESMKAHVVSGEERPDFAKNGEPLIAANAGQHADAGVLPEIGRIALTDSDRSKFITEGQFSLRDKRAGKLFHDVTASSRGLAVDVTRGRFKYDFSLFSQLPREKVQGLPLYRADGKVNDFSVSGGGLGNSGDFQSIGSNVLGAYRDTTRQPGIHMEELWTYSNLYRNLSWSSGLPELRAMSGAENASSPDFRRRALSDPWFSYSKPVFSAIQFVLSFVSAPDPVNAGKFRMLMQMDVLVKIWNPNNVRVVVPPGSSYAVQLLSIPFKVQWNITSATPAARPQSGLGNNTYALNRGAWPSSTNRYGHQTFQWLRGNIGGLAQSGTSNGYTLEPGECKIFGHDRNQNTASWSADPNVNLSPGWGPGRQALIIADFGATNLTATDSIEFIVTPDKDCIPTSSNHTYCNEWIGIRSSGSQASGGNGGLAIGGSAIHTGVNFTTPDAGYFPVIRSSQRLTVSQYATAKPFMIFGNYLNVEQPSSTSKDAFPSAARLLTNSAVTGRRFGGLTPALLQTSQIFWRADPLPLSYDSPLIDISSRDQGRFGGGHTIEHGVVRAATRQIDAAPPLSLMSLSHAIANGFADRFAQASERSARGLDVLQSDGLSGNEKFQAGDIAFSTVTYAAPQVERAIGNSYLPPAIDPAKVTGAGVFHAAESGTVPAFDHSYLANAALFDSWFCSGLHDGSRIPSGAPYADSRPAVTVLTDFFERGGREKSARLLNPRVIPATSATDALAKLKSGSALNSEAISRLGAHVFLDGAFNINSTSKDAWKALLATARGAARRNVTAGLVVDADKTPVGSSGLVAAGTAAPSASANEIEQWSGFRALDDSQLDELASKIVDRVRERGPFLSLADFLNRRPSGTGDQRLIGAVQAAIEDAGLNKNLKQGSRGLSAADLSGMPGAAVASAAGGMSRSAGIPGHVMQSDVLAPVANELTPRGDTFRIRAYGAATDGTGRVIAETWCDAIVQRHPEYIDPTDSAETPAVSLKSNLNKSFGRRFHLVRFQWLVRGSV